MKCPKCKEGRIRVIIDVVCDCNHHPLICDKCSMHFFVECSEPCIESVLPPDIPMRSDEKATADWRKALESIGVDHSKIISGLPLLEDFKEFLTQKASE